jgi:hypothetical protein
VRRLGPQAALTGPVVRNDADTVARHLSALRNDEATRRLYLLLARDTLALAGAAGRESVADVLAETPVPAAAPPQPDHLRAARRARHRGATSAAEALRHLGATA